jgi:DNA-binding NarL/FixJ family response regulator
MDPIKILIADSHILAQKGIACLLEESSCYNFCIKEVSSKEMLTEKLVEWSPFIIIIDPYSFGFASVCELKEIAKLAPAANIMVVSSQVMQDDLPAILDCNVSQYLLKSCTGKEFNEAVDAAIRGKKYVCAAVLDAILYSQPGRRKNPENLRLTPAETQILKNVARGLTTREIADSRNLSAHTVNTHRKHILKKLGARNTSDLVIYALKNGLVESHEYSI